jgi:hypothetical protein
MGRVAANGENAVVKWSKEVCERVFEKGKTTWKGLETREWGGYLYGT